MRQSGTPNTCILYSRSCSGVRVMRLVRAIVIMPHERVNGRAYLMPRDSALVPERMRPLACARIYAYAYARLCVCVRLCAGWFGD